MPKYKAVLFAPDGDWVTDYKADTKEEVMELLANRGSMWFFYPIEAIIRDRGNLTTAHQRIVNVWEPLDAFIGKSIKSVSKFLASNPDLVNAYLGG